MSDTPIPTTHVGQALSQSYVEWPAIFAGAIVAAAISTIMSAFGAALGLSGSYVASGTSGGRAVAIAAALWVVWIVVSSFVVGGYLAGRMRSRIHDATEHESDVRDGVHGLVVWGLGALMIAYLATVSVIGVAKTAAAAASVIGPALSAATDQSVDKLFRSSDARPAVPDGLKKETVAILALAANDGNISDDDKAYVVAQIAARTGISAGDASKRLDQSITDVRAAEVKVKQTAESARKSGILLAFLTAASLAISAAGAWWAATMGGKHRDENVDLSHLTTSR